MQLGLQTQSKKTKKKEMELPKKLNIKKNKKLSAIKVKESNNTLIQDNIALQDIPSMQSVTTLLLLIVLCVTLSYLSVTFAGDKLAMHWMGV